MLGSLGGLLLICFRSRCTQISVMWGCYRCVRDVGDDSDEEPAVPGAAAAAELDLIDLASESNRIEALVSLVSSTKLRFDSHLGKPSFSLSRAM